MYLRRGLYNTFKRRKKNGKTKCQIKLPFQKHFLISDSIAALSCFLKERIWSGNSAWVSVATKLTCVNGCLSEQWKIKTDQVQESLYNELRKFYKLSEFVAIFWYSFPLLKYLARWMEAICISSDFQKIPVLLFGKNPWKFPNCQKQTQGLNPWSKQQAPAAISKQGLRK